MRYANPIGRLLASLAISLILISNVAAGEVDCGVLKNWLDFGPFDYQDPQNRVPTGADPMGRIKRVENVHFRDDMKVVNLKRYSVERLSGEFVYTLRVFPNHPEALHAMSRLEKLAGGKLPQNAISPFTPKISADCFYDRAIRFRPEDPHVRYMHAIHLHDRKQYAEAREAYALAEKLGMDNPNFFYNYGLVLADLKDWEAARGYAQKAYAAGFHFEGLRRRLTEAGYAP